MPQSGDASHSITLDTTITQLGTIVTAVSGLDSDSQAADVNIVAQLPVSDNTELTTVIGAINQASGLVVPDGVSVDFEFLKTLE